MCDYDDVGHLGLMMTMLCISVCDDDDYDDVMHLYMCDDDDVMHM